MEAVTHGLYDDMLTQTHVLIAGATGSGKSVVINGMIYNALFASDEKVKFILIDPKRVELALYRDLPHTICYASEPDTMIAALDRAMNIVESRYDAMQRDGLRKYRGSHIYVIIDELADLMTTCRKQVQPLIQRLCQIGRAANVHVIAATQCPLAAVIPTPIKVNFDCIMGLHTRCRRDSINIMEEAGCEELPRYGYGYYRRPERTSLVEIPMYNDDEIETLVNFRLAEARGAEPARRIA